MPFFFFHVITEHGPVRGLPVFYSGVGLGETLQYVSTITAVQASEATRCAIHLNGEEISDVSLTWPWLSFSCYKEQMKKTEREADLEKIEAERVKIEAERAKIEAENKAHLERIATENKAHLERIAAENKAQLKRIEAENKAHLERIAASKEAEQSALEGKQYDLLQSAFKNGQITGNQVHEFSMVKAQARPGINISLPNMAQPRDRPKTMPVKTLM